ncbi:MAG TPA: hypothetical protein PKV50_05250 [Prolixibacteraceae bacterium]|nr:hypothetical protein [Prolixibacteraceae bacterium]
MYEKISKSREIIDRLKDQGKVKPMNSADDMAKISSMNKYMEEVRMEYRMKESQSQISAAQVILNY